MILNNKLDKSFGPVGSSAGVFLCIAGFAVTYFALTGLILVLIGAFVGFTTTSTFADIDNRRFRFSTNLFGFIPTGKWIDVDETMKIGIKNSRKGWRAYSRSNRMLDITDSDVRLVLLNQKGNVILPIKKFTDIQLAKQEQDVLCKTLGIQKF